MQDKISRKQFLVDSAKIAAGVAVGGGILGSLSNSAKAASSLATWPFPYKALDVEKARIMGHDTYYAGKGCGYGAFHTIIALLRESIGDPFNGIPTELMIFGAGGGVGWGTLCGALNGAAAAVCIVCDKANSDKINNELFGWYTIVNLPTDASNQLAVEKKYTQNKYEKALYQNKCGSILCHTSVTEWCRKSKFKVTDTERKERCARITGDCAAYAIQLLNDNLAGTFKATYTTSDMTKKCQSCHAGGIEYTVASNMECTQCHGQTMHALPSSVQKLGAAAGTTYILSQNYPNPFNPTTTIQFSLPKAETVKLVVYDAHGRMVRELIDGKNHESGLFEVSWDGKNALGENCASGVYFSKIIAGKYTATNKMILAR